MRDHTGCDGHLAQKIPPPLQLTAAQIRREQHLSGMAQTAAGGLERRLGGCPATQALIQLRRRVSRSVSRSAAIHMAPRHGRATGQVARANARVHPQINHCVRARLTIYQHLEIQTQLQIEACGTGCKLPRMGQTEMGAARQMRFAILRKPKLAELRPHPDEVFDALQGEAHASETCAPFRRTAPLEFESARIGQGVELPTLRRRVGMTGYGPV